MAAAAMALDRATLGTVTATAAEMRARQNDQIGFTDINDAALAVERSPGNVALTVRWNDTYEHFKEWIVSGRGAVLLGEYYVIPDRLSCQPSFNAGHAFFVNEFSVGLGYYCYDPLCSGPKWYPEAMIKEYAARFARTGKASAAYTEATGVGVISIYPGFGSDANLRDAASVVGKGIQYLLLLILILVGLWLYTKGFPKKVTIEGGRDAFPIQAQE